MSVATGGGPRGLSFNLPAPPLASGQSIAGAHRALAALHPHPRGRQRPNALRSVPVGSGVAKAPTIASREPVQTVGRLLVESGRRSRLTKENGPHPAPGSKLTMLTCMSCRRSVGSTNRVVDHLPSVPGMEIGSMSFSFVTKASGSCNPSTCSYDFRIQWNLSGLASWLRNVHSAPGGS